MVSSKNNLISRCTPLCLQWFCSQAGHGESGYYVNMLPAGVSRWSHTTPPPERPSYPMSRVCKSRPIAGFLRMGRVPCCPTRLVVVSGSAASTKYSVLIQLSIASSAPSTPASPLAHAFNNGPFFSAHPFHPSIPEHPKISLPTVSRPKRRQRAIHPKPQIGRAGTVGTETGWKGVMWILRQPQMPGCSTHYHRALSANLPGEANTS